MALPDDKRPGKRGAVACLPAARSHEEPDPGGFRCISTKTDPEHSGPFVVQESGVALPDDKRPEKELQFRAPQQHWATRNPAQVVSSAYLQKTRPGTFRPLHFSGALGWRCRMANSQNRQRYSFVCPSSTEPQGTRPRRFQVHISNNRSRIPR